MNTLSFILLQAQQQEGSPYSFFILLGGMFLIMYFFMIRPQMKRQKEAKSFREQLQKGDKVVTIGGVHGKVVEINETSVVLSVEQGKIRVDKNSLSASNAASPEELQKKS